jgi:hypothetical protein
LTGTGNILPVPGEDESPDISGPDIHRFPEKTGPAETRYEEFNWRLFTYVDELQPTVDWAPTLLNDFPTDLKGSTQQIMREVERRLRPAYPVIFDLYGWWSYASRQLARNPRYSDVVVRAYMEIPADQRPVVVSRIGAVVPPERKLLLLRYGFQPFPLTDEDIDFDHVAGLRLAFRALLGPRRDWLWFSVPRMRYEGIRANEELRQRVEAKERVAAWLQEEIQKKAQFAYANRFDQLFDRQRKAPVKLPANETIAANPGDVEGSDDGPSAEPAPMVQAVSESEPVATQ